MSPAPRPIAPRSLDDRRPWATTTSFILISAILIASYADIGDSRIGQILSAPPLVASVVWPPEQIRDVIELCRSRDLEDGLAVGVSNRRGVTVRLPTDGGELERDLAARYRADALACALTWPRTRAVLERIAESYDAHAKWEDEHAEQRDWA